MLQASEHVDTNIFGDLCIVRTVWRNVNQRRGAAPIFVRGVGEEYFRRGVRSVSSVEQTSGLAGLRIGLGKIGERKKIGGKEDAGERLSVARRLRETMIETLSAGTRHGGGDSVLHLPALLVGVEILVEKMAEKAPTLRNSDSVDALYGCRGLRIVFQIGEEIADSSQAEASDDWILPFVNDFIDFAGLKSAVEMNEMRIGREFAIQRMGETPLGARNRLARAIRRIAHRQNIFRTGGIIDRIAFSAGWSEERVTERHVFHFLRGCKIRTHETMNLFSSGIVGNRSKEPEVFSVVGDVEFPADPGNRVAFAHKKAVTEFGVGIGRRYTVHEAQNSFSAAV